MDGLKVIIIEVPDKNDSIASIVLDGQRYYIRFTWNDTGGFWKFGVYSNLREPILIGRKIMPNFPVNLYAQHADIPFGAFGAITKLDRIGRMDFVEGRAQFGFVPAQKPLETENA